MFKDFILNATLFISSLVFMDKFIKKERLKSPYFEMAIGAFFGSIGIILMFLSIVVEVNVIADLRHLAVVFAALFGGIPAAILSALFISFGRIVFFTYQTTAIVAAIFIMGIGIINGLISTKNWSRHRKFWLMNCSSIFMVIIALSLNLRHSEELGKVLTFHVGLSLLIGYFSYLISEYIFKGNELMKKLKENEENFRALAGKYEAVVSNIREVIFQLDPDGRILFVNAPWEKVTGFRMEESLGRNILEFMLKEETRGVRSMLDTRTVNGEFYLITKDLRTKIVEFSMNPLYNVTGKMYGYSGSINDITERKQQDELIRASKDYVESINRNLELSIQEEVKKNRQKDHILIQQSRLAAMGEMIASIGHQWRQPLNNLSLLIQDVGEAREFGEIDDLYIDRFTRESMVQIKHMSRTINDFRKFYSPNKEKSAFCLAESIEDALSIFGSSLKNHDIHVQFEYRGKHLAFGFPNEFSQVVLNILTNARDAFLHNNVQNRMIHITIEDQNDYMSAIFTDNAGGIKEPVLEKIFDPYYTTRPHGTGLGLYMTKMILDNMNGNVGIENTCDGAKFTLLVPKSKSEYTPAFAATIQSTAI